MHSSQTASTVWPPPPDFVPVSSKVEGISVYAPRSHEEAQEETRSFKCPHCGGVTTYSASQQKLTCPHCGRTQPIEAQAVGRRAGEHEFTLETMEKARRGWGRERTELRCESCGAAVTVDPEALTHTCAFCGSNRVLARDTQGDALRPMTLIPFTVDQQACRQSVNHWLGQGWMHPAELSQGRSLCELSGVYLPYWTFDATVRAHWKAEVGHQETRRYYSDGQWKTRTVTIWRWESGRIRLPVDDHLIPGTTHVSRVLLQGIEPFDLSELVTYEPGYLAGWQAKVYDVPLPQAWEEAKEEIRAAAKRACRQDIRSGHVRNLRVTADFGQERWRYILLPVHLASYRFDGRTFQVMVNGQTGAVAGQKPVAWLKVWLVVAAILAPGALASLIGLATLPFAGIGMMALILGLILFAAGLVGGFVVLRKARASEEL